MDEETIQKIAEAVAKTMMDAQGAKSLNIWDYLDIHRWIPQLVALALACGTAIAVIYRCAVFYVQSGVIASELAETKKAYEDEKASHDVHRNILARNQETCIKDGLIFLRHEAPPKSPLCPSCYSEGKIMPMTFTRGILSKKVADAIKVAHDLGIKVNPDNTARSAIGFTCVKCDCEFQISKATLEHLSEELFGAESIDILPPT